MKNFDIIWQEVKKILEKEINKSQYNMFVDSLILSEIDEKNNEITLLTPEFNITIVKMNYLPQIKNTIYKLTGEKIEINISSYENELIYEDEQKNKIKQDNNIDKKFINDYKQNSDEITNLIPNYTFEEFVVGNSNNFAYNISQAIAKSPAKDGYNPLFIYGGVGLGKTHLMHAIGNYIKKENKNAIISYVTTEKFTNELISAIQYNSNTINTNEIFRNRYRNVDVLLIDDIQFLIGKRATQLEFFHTFNTLRDDNKQIIISSDRPPQEFEKESNKKNSNENGLDERLISRFNWGITVDIQPPDYETRIAILRKKTKEKNLEVKNDVHEYIANNIVSNIRELEGALNTIKALSELTNQKIDLNLAKQALKDSIKPQKSKQITIDDIKEKVANYYNIELSDLESKSRKKSISYPRQIAMYLCRELTSLSTTKIGEEFGKDHSTILHGCEKIKNDLSINHNLENEINNLIHLLKN